MHARFCFVEYLQPQLTQLESALGSGIAIGIVFCKKFNGNKENAFEICVD